MAVLVPLFILLGIRSQRCLKIRTDDGPEISQYVSSLVYERFAVGDYIVKDFGVHEPFRVIV
ncbi:hypothetical protein ACEZDB_12165 [Streptacidiphilus sp. N1-3]|uniref:DUF7489 domain-containing protein n=1 Tax=Streptacidiphilus alkalitolerans TaxID=3342712 RepID=A0ABV6WZC0_9ACTN